MKTYLLLCSIAIVLLLLLASCMTPRQVEAGQILMDLYQQGRLTREQLDILLAALDPNNWLRDTIAIGSSLASGGGFAWFVNKKRDAKRVARGEPVAVPKVPA